MTHDLRFALRAIRTSRGFTAVVVLTLALGIGANTAIFSFTSAILLRPLPFHDPDRLVLLQQAPGRSGHITPMGIGLFAEDYLEIKASSQSLVDVATYTLAAATLVDGGAPDLVDCVVVTDNFFTVLGTKAAVGRLFTPADRATSAGRLAVVNHAYWTSQYGRDPAVIGRAITLNGVAFTIVGVAPPDYEFPNARFYVSPAGSTPEVPIGRPNTTEGRGHYVRSLVGRLRPGITLAAAEAELHQLISNLPNPDNLSRPVHAVTMRHQIVGNVRPMLGILFGCATVVLFIACLNVANLQLSRATTRQTELGIRLAIGASRWQIVRPLLMESALLSLLGGLAGIIVATLSLKLLVGVAPSSIPRLGEVSMDGWVFAFAFGLSVLTGLACGLGPALSSVSLDLSRWLNQANRGGSAAPRIGRLRATLVTLEVALAFSLLIAAGLLVRSFQRLVAVDWGVASVNVVTMRLGLADPRFEAPGARREVSHALLERVRTLPGFKSVSLSYDRIGKPWITLPFTPAGHEPAKPEDRPRAWFHAVSPDYFRTLGIPLLRGRDFIVEDNANALVAIVDAAVANRFFPEGAAVGQHLRLSFEEQPFSIVGVVGAVKSGGPDAAPSMDIYLPVTRWDPASVYLSVQTRLTSAAVVAAVRTELDRVDPGVPIADVATLEQIVDRATHARRFPLVLIGTFAMLALMLAAVGVYSIAAYSVVQRTREIGIRLALGAQTSTVVAHLVSQGLAPVMVGLVIGLGGSVFAAFAMRQLLFSVPPLDAITFLATPPLLAAIALLACWLPARRAARVDPIITLRAQ